MKKMLIPMILIAAILSGCSSIISKSEYSITINSTPDVASFVVTNRAGQKVHRGITPSSVILKSSSGYFKGETYTITLNKAGYSAKAFTITSSLDGWYWGNIFFGGLIGMLIVDPATGAMYKLPDRIDISLDAQSAKVGTAETLTIATIDSLTEEQLSRLKKIQ
ncbi:hypothetical protein MNBD_GAMMA16-363 [hydrothermal vent metagenome]|uniref:PEGA domain-containing protein n=1 Tax=hydrothermal vent metagenome TaxID=652676 RepID=A0A3B0Z6U2_9ZZZZ